MLALDSNILIAYLNGDEKIVQAFATWRATNVGFLISVITQIETLSLPNISDGEIERIERFLGEFTILPLDTQLARIAADIRRLTRLSLGDSIVAATAKFTNFSLITNDRELIRKANGVVSIQKL